MVGYTNTTIGALRKGFTNNRRLGADLVYPTGHEYEDTVTSAEEQGSIGVICTCNHFAPERRDFVKPVFNRELATYWSKYSTCARKVYEATLDELYVHHAGTLHGLDREPLNLWGFDENGDDLVDCAFGSGYRNLRRYLARAEVNRVNRLSREHHDLALLLHHARAIRNCRTIGLCAQRRCVSD